jgi:hypothetical protein
MERGAEFKPKAKANQSSYREPVPLLRKVQRKKLL